MEWNECDNLYQIRKEVLILHMQWVNINVFYTHKSSLDDIFIKGSELLQNDIKINPQP